METLIDPRPLTPPDPAPEVETTTTVWHFYSQDGYDDYALTPAERDRLHAIYTAAGVPFIVTTETSHGN